MRRKFNRMGRWLDDWCEENDWSIMAQTNRSGFCINISNGRIMKVIRLNTNDTVLVTTHDKSKTGVRVRLHTTIGRFLDSL